MPRLTDVAWSDLRRGDVLSWDGGEPIDGMLSPITIGARFVDYCEAIAGLDLANRGYVYTETAHRENVHRVAVTRGAPWGPCHCAECRRSAEQAPSPFSWIVDERFTPLTTPRTSHRQLSEQDEDRALDLRQQGYTWNEVARTMGLPPTTAGRYSLARWAAYRARKRHGMVLPRVAPGLINRRFGIEIEFNRSNDCDLYVDDMQEAIAQACRDQGLQARVERYNHNTLRWWKMTTDSTVSGGEFVSPPMRTETGLQQVKIALDAVKDNGGSTADNVGMHVHHDVTDFTREQIRHLVRVLRVWERPVMAFVPAHRWRGGNTCGASILGQYEWDWLEAESLTPRRSDGRGFVPHGRYWSINFEPVMTYGTVEFRGLGHTLSYAKVDPWVRVTQAIVEYARRELPIPTSDHVDDMLTVLVDHELITDATSVAFRRHATTDRQRDLGIAV